MDVSGNTTYTVDNGEFFTKLLQLAVRLDIDAGKTGRISFSNQNLSYTLKLDADGDSTFESYTIDGATKDFNTELTRVANEIAAKGGVTLTATNKSGVLEIVNNHASDAIAFEDAALVAPGSRQLQKARHTSTCCIWRQQRQMTPTRWKLAAGSNVSGTNGTVATPSQMSLTFSADDRYTFAIDKDGGSTADATITADVTNGDLDAVVNVINSHSASTGITASVSGNSVIMERPMAQALSFTASRPSRTVRSTQPTLLVRVVRRVQNATGGTSATIGATGAAVETEMTLTFSTDTYSFKITDGTSTAAIRATEVQADDAAGTATTPPTPTRKPRASRRKSTVRCPRQHVPHFGFDH